MFIDLYFSGFKLWEQEGGGGRKGDWGAVRIWKIGVVLLSAPSMICCFNEGIQIVSEIKFEKSRRV